MISYGRVAAWFGFGALVLFLVTTSPGGDAASGLAADDVLVVVNPESWASLTVANEYLQQRPVPSINVLALPWRPDRQDDALDVERFREAIPSPRLPG